MSYTPITHGILGTTGSVTTGTGIKLTASGPGITLPGYFQDTVVSDKEVVTNIMDLFKELFRHVNEEQKLKLQLELYEYLTSSTKINKTDLATHMLDALKVERANDFLDALDSIPTEESK